MKTLRDYVSQLPLGLDTPVLGELPLTADGCVVGHNITVFGPDGYESYETGLNDPWFDELTIVGDEVRPGTAPYSECYSTKEAAHSAAKGTP